MITKKSWEESLEKSEKDLINAKTNLIEITKAVELVEHEVKYLKEKIKNAN